MIHFCKGIGDTLFNDDSPHKEESPQLLRFSFSLRWNTESPIRSGGGERKVLSRMITSKKQKRWWITHVEDLINDMELFSHFSHFTVWLVSANCTYLSVSLFVASVSPLEYSRVTFIYKNSQKYSQTWLSYLKSNLTETDKKIKQRSPWLSWKVCDWCTMIFIWISFSRSWEMEIDPVRHG